VPKKPRELDANNVWEFITYRNALPEAYSVLSLSAGSKLVPHSLEFLGEFEEINCILFKQKLQALQQE
jgi:hypothetical protein